MKLLLDKLFKTLVSSNLLFNILKRSRYTVLLTILLGTSISVKANDYLIYLQLDTSDIENVENVLVVGNVPPISQTNGYLLQDNDGNGIYEATIKFDTNKRNVKFKFVVNGETELQGTDARVIWFNEEVITKAYVFNEYDFYDKEQIERLTYTDSQIDADIDILQEIIQYVHPNIYKFRDSLELQKDFKSLRNSINQDPTLPNAYGAISQFAAKIKCSHTFTNPWNQGISIKKALFNQQDKIPFTFNRIGKRMFIDKNASNNQKLTKGLEIVEINGNRTSEIFSKLSEYVSSDGNNYEKKLERLVVRGEEKYPLFDIFYPIEFGSSQQFVLKLKNTETEENFETQVKATSKTNRTRILINRYGILELSVKDGWNFEIIENNTAKLTLKSFAVQSNEFQWEDYLDDVFEKLSESKASNLIIDIRGNEGGQGEVGQYILERIIQKPLKVNAMQASVRYLKIPSDYKKHISTWSKLPYDFSNKIQLHKNGRYILKDRYSIPETTFKPKRNRFKGRVYLLTDASNSSATHLMAMYAKQIENITIVGQETGGNQLGTNGNYLFFLRLPNTKIELDIPVVGQYIPIYENPIDGGVVPHVKVEKNVSDFRNDVDTELNTVMSLIKNN